MSKGILRSPSMTERLPRGSEILGRSTILQSLSGTSAHFLKIQLVELVDQAAPAKLALELVEALIQHVPLALGADAEIEPASSTATGLRDQVLENDVERRHLVSGGIRGNVLRV